MDMHLVENILVKWEIYRNEKMLTVWTCQSFLFPSYYNGHTYDVWCYLSRQHLKHCGKKRKFSLWAISLFDTMLSTPLLQICCIMERVKSSLYSKDSHGNRWIRSVSPDPSLYIFMSFSLACISWRRHF